MRYSRISADCHIDMPWLPADLFTSNASPAMCKATFQFDRIGAKLIDDIGVETLMWGSDYPHPDGVWPESSRFIAEQFGHLPEDVVHKITCENAARFYGLTT